MTNSKLSRSAVQLLCVATLVTSTAGVYAEREVVLEEVVVTARKRGAESLQEIAGSVQVISGDYLSDTAAVGFNDYMRSVPSLSANNSGTGQTQLSLRGITSTRLNHANPNVPSTVGLYFDETPISTSGFNPDAGLFDVARIEVLRGPQGTLFGASSMSGAIRIIPNEPNTEGFFASATLSGYSTEEGDPSFTGHGVINVPVSDDFAVRAVGFNITKGGYIDNIYTGEDDYNDENIFGGRITGLWRVTDAFRAKAMFMYQNTKADGRPDEQRRNDPRETTTSGGFPLALPGETADQFVITDELQTSKFIEDSFDDEFFLGSLQLDLELNRFSVTSITSYFDREFEDILDDTRRTRNLLGIANSFGAAGAPVFLLGDFTPGTQVGAVPVDQVSLENSTSNEKFTQELRLHSRFDGPLNFVAGFYYEDDSRTLDQLNQLPGLDDWIQSPNNLDGFFLGGTFNSPEENAYFDGTFDVETRQLAFFFEANFQIGDFELTGGGRYFDYTQEAFIHWQGWVEFGDDILDEETSESGFLPNAEIAYNATDDILFYAKASKGFRVGSVQQFINPVFCAAELAALGISSVPTTIDSDSLWNYEGGAKTTWFGGTTTANLSIYHIDWSDARTQTFLQCGWIAEFGLIDIDSDGVELQIDSQVTNALNLHLAVGYNDSRVDGDLPPSAPPIGSDGDRAPFSPEWTLNAGFNYVLPNVLNRWDWFLRGNMSHVSSQFSELGTGQLQRIEIPSSTAFNLYSGFDGESWRVTLFARNLTDERIVTGADVDRNVPAQLGRARPRNVGVQVSYDFE